MKLTEAQLELIQKYLSNTLSESDQLLFDTEKKNEAFKKELLAQIELLNSIELSKDDALRDKLKSLDSSMPKTVKLKSNRFSWLKVAASLAVLLVAGLLLKQNLGGSNDLSTDQLFAEYYQVMPAEFNQRNQTSTLDKSFEAAMEKYQGKDYSASLDLLGKIEPTTTKIQLYQALSHLELNNITEAQSLLSFVSKSNNYEENQNAEWYLALSYLKQSKPTLAKETLKNIIKQPEHLFLKQATKLLEELN